MLARITVHALAALGLVSAAPLAAQDNGLAAPGETLLMLNALGEAEAMPDTLGISIGVTSAGATAEEALNANSASIERMIAILGRNGTEGLTITSTEFGVEPTFPEDRRREEDVRIIGYVAEATLEVEFANFDRAAVEVIPELFEAGANDVRGPFWGIKDQRIVQNLRDEATRSALAEASRNADLYADALDLRVSRVVRVADTRIIPRTYDASDGRIIVTGSAVRPIPIVPVPVRIEADVYIEYALVPQE